MTIIEHCSKKLGKTHIHREIIHVHRFIGRFSFHNKLEFTDSFTDAIVKVSVLPKLITGFKANPIKIPVSILTKSDKLILNHIWKFDGSRITIQSEKEEQDGT